jgi:P27 family predicted phage terminase small subunit
MTGPKKSQTKAPPRHLSKAMQAWWRQVEKACVLEPHDRHLLQLACEAFDRAQAARAVLDKEGTIFLDRFEQPKARPEAAIECDARRDFAALVRQLSIPPEEVPHDASSPPFA